MKEMIRISTWTRWKIKNPEQQTLVILLLVKHEIFSEFLSILVDLATGIETLTPSKLIRSAVINLLKYVSIVIGLEAEQVSSAAALNFSSCLRSIIEKGQQRPNSGGGLDDSIMFMAADEQVCQICSS